MINKPMHLDQSDKITLDLKGFNAQQVLVLGVRGSGKSNTTAVIAEELLEAQYPITIVDAESEYYTLREQYPILVVGNSPHVDLQMDATKGAQLADWVFDNNTSVILDLLGYSEMERDLFLHDYFSQFWERIKIASRNHFIIIDEAHEFIPQGKNSKLKTLIKTMCLRGRKRGLGMLIATQRPASVEKTIITQSAILFLHKVVYPTDLSIYGELLPMKMDAIKEAIPNMQAGQVMAMVNYKFIPATIRPRHTTHAGATPDLEGATATEIPNLKTIPEEILESLKGSVTGAKAVRSLEQVLAENEALRRQVEELTNQVKALEGTLAHVKSQPATATPSQASDEFTQMARATQQKKLEAEMKRLKKTSVAQQRMLAYLMSEEGRSLQVAEIAHKIGYSVDHLRNNPPHDLLLGLILRHRMLGQYTYTSNVNQWIQQKFPDLDCAEAREQVYRTVAESMKASVK